MLSSVLAFLLAGITGTTIIVPTQQPNLTSAIAALSGPGPHVVNIVVDGQYDEPGSIDVSGMDITINGTGMDTTIVRNINGGDSEVFVQATGAIALNDLTLTGDRTIASAGFPSDCEYPSDMRGVTSGNAEVNLNNVAIHCFSSSSGAGVFADRSDVSITRSEFTFNEASVGAGGHLFVSGASFAASTLAISGSTFSFGSAEGPGGAIAASDATVSVRDSVFFENSAAFQGGAVAIVGGAGGPAEVWNNQFTHNSALRAPEVGEGGGVYLDALQVDVWGNVFCGNEALTGGGAYLRAPDRSTVQNNVFNGNRASSRGGGLAVLAGSGTVSPDVTNNTFWDNAAGLAAPMGSLVVGEGGAAFFDGVAPDFQNNIVAGQIGGGVTGVEGANYRPGEPLSFNYNLWFENCGGEACPNPLAGDFAQHTLAENNIVGQDPIFVFAAGGASSCSSDALFVRPQSPAVDAGSDAETRFTDVDGSRNDIGFTGGSRAQVQDRDRDGFMNTLDCDDMDSERNPSTADVCDTIDNDCDGAVDEGSTVVWYPDGDSDGVGRSAEDGGTPVEACVQPANHVAVSGDCDDGDASVSPSAAEACDGVDNDCDDSVDEGLERYTYFMDADGDGFGDDATAMRACAPPSSSYLRRGGDCDDGEAAAHPGAIETCDGVDNDCNLRVDDNASDGSRYYLDRDGDGRVDSSSGVIACAPFQDYLAPDSALPNPFDCDDANPSVGDCPEAPSAGGGGGCSSTGRGPVGSAPVFLAGLLVLLALRRRRARVAGSRVRSRG